MIKEMYKLKFLPSITDYTRDYPEYRDASDWSKLDDWIFITFHPKGSSWVIKGTIILFYFALVVVAGLNYLFAKSFMGLIVSALIFVYSFKYIKDILKLYKEKKTIYEMFFKEY